MRILYYKKNDCITEGRLLGSLIDLGLDEDILITNLTLNDSLDLENEFNIDYLFKTIQSEYASDIADRSLIPFSSIQKIIQKVKPIGKFSSKIYSVIDLLIQSRDKMTSEGERPKGISGSSLLNLLAYAYGLDHLKISSLFMQALPLSPAQTQENRLIEAVYQLCQTKVFPIINEPRNITWIAAALLSRFAEFNVPEFQFLKSVTCHTGSLAVEGELLQVILGEKVTIEEDQVIELIQTTIDDMSPQLMSFAIYRLYEAGALDVYQIPVYMKKNRLGIQLNVTIRQCDEAKMANLILKETTSLGVLVHPLDHGYHADVNGLEIETKFGKVSLKQKYVENVLIQSKPEYEAAVKIISEQQISMDDLNNEITRCLQIRRKNHVIEEK